MLAFWGCVKNEIPDIENEEEIITTVIVTLSPQTGPIVSLEFNDPDGNGGTSPTISGGILQKNQTYNGTISFLNESVSPAESITEEINEEAEEHQVFYLNTSTLEYLIEYMDSDAGGFPVGLQFQLTTFDATGEGELTVVLRHEPDKDAMLVSDGVITNAGGETDVEVTFPIIIQ